MKIVSLFFIAVVFCAAGSLGAAEPICNAAVCAPNQGALVWENDLFGLYAYGPRNYHQWSGIDVFNKSVPGNVSIAWSCDPALAVTTRHPNLHDDRGEGMDNYTMGAARGVGAVAIWADGEWKTYTGWTDAKILHTGDDYVQFELTYPMVSCLGRMFYRVTLRRGEHFCRNDVRFEFPNRLAPGFRVGPGLDLEPKRDHKGDLVEEKGLVSLYEDAKGKDGSTMEAIFVRPGEDVEMMTDHLNCRVIGFKKGGFTYWTGAYWSKAGKVSSPADWHALVRHFRNNTKEIKQ